MVQGLEVQMKFRWFHFGLALALSATTASIGCKDQPLSESEQQAGTLSLPLVTSSGAMYRLTDATFVIKSQAGTPVATLDSESDPDAQALTTALGQGHYNVRLQDGWVLNEVQADGTEAPVRAALISTNPQSFQITTGLDTDLSFSFTTDVGTVTIGEGTLNIGVDVAEDATGAGCNLISSYYNNCPSGRTCLVAGESGETFCASPGSLPVGSACDTEQCVAGSQCFALDPNAPEQGACTQFCDTSYPLWECSCLSLGLDNSNTNAGICGAKPAGACDLLEQTGCAPGEACQYQGGSFGTCGAPGATAPGEACSGETCTLGYQCFNGACRSFCDTRLGSFNNPACPNNGYYYNYCEHVGTGHVGRCSY
jgi:hypothetical protein